MSAPRASGFSGVLKQRVSGVVFLLVLAGLVALTIALYQKAFTPVVEVTLRADKIGNQLSPPSDVKLRGLIVGEVRDVSTAGDGPGATLDLALDPDKVDLIPKNVEAQLLPKTLFGEKFVALIVPEDASAEPIEEGDVIPQDRSETARETEEALNNLLPLLQTLKPQQLSVTLNALSSALRGRGDQLGENLEIVDTYLQEFNPELPRLGENMRGLADYADILDEAAPDFLQVLDNLSFINRSLVDQEDGLNTFLTSTTAFTDEMGSFLRENEQRFITLAADSLPNLQVLARYSPEFPCLAEGLAIQGNDQGGRLGQGTIGDVFGGLQPGLHITLEFVPQREGYQPRIDEPQFKDDRGPNCFGLPNPPVPAEDINFQDGFRDEGPPDSTDPPEESSSSPAANPASFLAPTSQRQMLDAVVAPVMGVPVDEVPDLASLLFGPVARGTVVGLAGGDR
jgi:phospholipid/cholesterol/gamma-HCH transport system substrate-binding protein